MIESKLGLIEQARLAYVERLHRGVTVLDDIVKDYSAQCVETLRLEPIPKAIKLRLMQKTLKEILYAELVEYMDNQAKGVRENEKH